MQGLVKENYEKLHKYFLSGPQPRDRQGRQLLPSQAGLSARGTRGDVSLQAALPRGAVAATVRPARGVLPPCCVSI